MNLPGAHSNINEDVEYHVLKYVASIDIIRLSEKCEDKISLIILRSYIGL